MSVLDWHFDKWTPEPNTGCYLWHAAITLRGYPNAVRNGRTIYPHRVVCEETHGPAPEGTEASHICGISFCVAPHHLLWETTSENMMRKSEASRRNNKQRSLRPRALRGAKLLASGRFSASIGHRGKRVYLGSFDTERDANDAYNAALWRIKVAGSVVI